MNILEMEVAVLNYADVRNNIVIPNVSWGIVAKIPDISRHGGFRHKPLHECDILALHPSGFATEYEIKTSLQDLKNDFKKKHSHDHPLIRRLFYVVPKSIEDKALDILPEGSGLCIVYKTSTGHPMMYVSVNPKANKDAVRWDSIQRDKLLHLGCMRIQTMKVQMFKAQEGR